MDRNRLTDPGDIGRFIILKEPSAFWGNRPAPNQGCPNT
jgi:hypothetical protein